MQVTMKQYIQKPISRFKVSGILREGQSLEEFLRKATQGQEPIEATAKLTYNDRKDGVLPQHDIRTDRFELAMMQTDKIHASQAAARQKQDFPEPAQEIVKAAQEGTKPAGEA